MERETTRVLYVDDDPDDHFLIKAYLSESQAAKYKLDWVKTYDEGLGSIMEDRHDIYILDYDLGAHNGLELLREVRRLERHAPIIVLTGAGDLEADLMAMEFGAADFLDKAMLNSPLLDRSIRYALAQTATEEQLRRHRSELELRVEERTSELNRTNETLRRQIAERSKAEQALRTSQVSLANAQRIAHLGNWDRYFPIDELTWSDEVYRIFGLEPESFTPTYAGFLDAIHPDDRELVEKAISQSLANGTPYEIEHRVVLHDQTERTVVERGEVRLDSNGKPLRMTGTVQDITYRKHAEQALIESNLRFQQLADHIRQVFWITNLEKSRMIYVSPAYEQIWGRSCQSLYNAPNSFLDSVHPEDRAQLEASIIDQAKGGYEQRYRIIRPDGSLRWIRSRAFPVTNDAGQVYRIAGIAEDITESVERDEQLRQSEKLSALGLLTGGVAHDFNNLLARISINAELLGERLGQDDPLIQNLIRATSVGSDLTQRLLVFSRQQVLQTETIEIDLLVTNLVEMLRRVLGETIIVETKLAEQLWPVRVDPGQMENSLLNLAINARDAMPHGGRLMIECSNTTLDEESAARIDLTPGDYVLLSATDTGIGMTQEVLDHAFEPFFTTKDAGKGTGLGLSMIYGFVKQSNGHIAINSEQGRGTTLSLYLPKSDVAAASPRDPVSTELPQSAGETILVVEDDGDLRENTIELLGVLGYNALGADNGEAALALLNENGDIDLLVCDVVLPNISGPEIVKMGRRQRPGLKAMFVSGYAPSEILDQGNLQAGELILQKPFTKHELAHAVRDAINQETP